MKRLLILSLLLVATPPLAADPLRDALLQLQQMGEPAAAPVELPDVIELTERDVTSFIAAARELEALDLEVAVDDSGIPDMADVLRGNAQAQRIISRHGFTVESINSVAYSLGLAFAAVQLEKDGEDLARARAQQQAALAEMRASMPPETFAMVERQMQSMGGMLDQIADQPPGNKALARRYMGELEQVFDFDDEDF